MREQQVGHSRVSINLGHSTVPNSNAVCLPSAGDLNSGVGIVSDQLVSLSHATSRKHARKQDHRDELRPHSMAARSVFVAHHADRCARAGPAAYDVRTRNDLSGAAIGKTATPRSALFTSPASALTRQSYRACTNCCSRACGYETKAQAHWPGEAGQANTRSEVREATPDPRLLGTMVSRRCVRSWNSKRRSSCSNVAPPGLNVYSWTTTR